MAKICPLFSSSSGNATLISEDEVNILVDCGVSARSLCAALEVVQLALCDIDAVFITHEHIDHIRCLKTLATKWNIPVFASSDTAKTLLFKGAVTEEQITFVDEETTIGHIKVKRCPTSHDCLGSSCYRFELKRKSVAVCTDLGIVSEEVRKTLDGCELIVFESNHDVMMLQNGSYAYSTKQRILSDSGHLSNVASASELPALVKNGTKRIILAHLSRDNNIPEIATASAKAALLDAGYHDGSDYILYAAPPSGGKVFYI